MSTTISPLRDAAGRIIGASLIARDISQRKRLEELRLHSFDLEAENTRGQEANRLKSEFLANMSQELRTLATIGPTAFTAARSCASLQPSSLVQ